MNKLLFALIASAIVAISLVTVAEARGPANSFAVGSGKSDPAFVGSERLSFSAHNTPGDLPCSATGHIEYANPFVSISGDVVAMTIIPNPTGGGLAWLGVIVTRSSDPFFQPVGDQVWFDAGDSGMHPDGTGDTFLFEGHSTVNFCFAPVVGHTITSGNIDIKAETIGG